MANDVDQEQEPMFHPDEEASRPGLARLPLAMAAGGVVAVGCGALWALVVVYTGFEVGWLAWGLGFLVGLAMIAVGRQKSATLGAAAVTMALVGLLVGKLLILPWSVPAAADEWIQDDAIMADIIFEEMVEKGEVDTEVATWITTSADDADPPPELEDRVGMTFVTVMQRLGQMSEEEKKELARKSAKRQIASTPMIDRLKATVSGWDILWAILALVSAWGICAGRSEEGG